MAKAIKTSSEGRKCQFPLCDNILSIYNHKDYCRLHWDQIPEDEKKTKANTPQKIKTAPQSKILTGTKNNKAAVESA